MILPTPGEAFAWRQFNGRPGLICTPLHDIAPHVFTTADWPLGTKTAAVPADGWPMVARAIGVDDGQLARAHQVHGTSVVVGPVPDDGPRPAADIVIVGEPGQGAAVQVADCVALLIADARTGVVAAVHAGWRGMAARGPQAAVHALIRAFGTRPADLVAAFGPSIGACCYEVGSDVRNEFAASAFGAPVDGWFADRPASDARNPTLPAVRERSRRPDRWFLDGWRAARAQLREVGVPDAQIFGAELCTASHPEFFRSFRRDGAPSGRMAGAIRCAAPRP